jgi:multisubunit Na+/H+ antiporter MnhG subunit
MAPELVHAISKRYLLGPILYIVAFMFVFLNAIVNLLLYIILPIFYFVPGPGDLPHLSKDQTDEKKLD